MRINWTITVHALALDKLRALKTSKPAEFEAVCKVMELLSKEADPRCPLHPKLDVCPIKYDAPGWYRCRTLHTNWRVVFRVLERVDGNVIEIHADDELHQRADLRALQITAAEPRCVSYGKALKDLWKKAS